MCNFYLENEKKFYIPAEARVSVEKVNDDQIELKIMSFENRGAEILTICLSDEDQLRTLAIRAAHFLGDRDA